MEEQRSHWGITFVIIILVLVIAIQGFMMHGLRQRMDKVEGKSGANPVASQTEPRTNEEAVSQVSQAVSENQQGAQEAQKTEPAPEAAKTQDATSTQSVKPTFSVDVAQTQTLASTEDQPAAEPAVTQKDTARLAVPPAASVSPATPAPAPKSKKVVTIPTVSTPEIVEEWVSEFPDEENDFWGSWEEMRNFEMSMRKMFREETCPRVMNFDPTATPMEVHVTDKGDVFEVAVNAPDVDLSSITVRMENKKFLKISGMKKRCSEEKDPVTGMFTRSEEVRHFVQGVFLPEPVNAKKIKIWLDQGWFKAALPKIKN